MNNDHISVRTPFRILYGIVSVMFVLGTYIDLKFLYVFWNNKILKFSEVSTWVLIALPFLFIYFAYIAFIIALRGKLPTYLVKYMDKNKNK